MKKRFQKSIIKGALGLFICLMLFGFFSIYLEAGRCDDAFSMCMDEFWWLGPFELLYCGPGYLFCLKYLSAK